MAEETGSRGVISADSEPCGRQRSASQTRALRGVKPGKDSSRRRIGSGEPRGGRRRGASRPGPLDPLPEPPTARVPAGGRGERAGKLGGPVSSGPLRACVRSLPAVQPRIGQPGAPPGSRAPIGRGCPTPGEGAEAESGIGGPVVHGSGSRPRAPPAAASPLWRRPGGPPRLGRPLGFPAAPAAAFAVAPAFPAASGRAPPTPCLPLRCGKGRSCARRGGQSPRLTGAAAPPLPRSSRSPGWWGAEPARAGAGEGGVGRGPAISE